MEQILLFSKHLLPITESFISTLKDEIKEYEKIKELLLEHTKTLSGDNLLHFHQNNIQKAELKLKDLQSDLELLIFQFQK